MVMSLCSSLPLQRNRPQQVGLHITKDKPVTQEEFGALLYDRLQAVQKDREAMEMKARERARKQGKSYSEIMVSSGLSHLSLCSSFVRSVEAISYLAEISCHSPPLSLIPGHRVVRPTRKNQVPQV